MYSEAARRQTFEKWPHMDYKWALPDQMAQAGFYHQPSVTGEDRAMCFTCNVCLVCWEKTDEPWSEHERHSPSCPFVKGEYTQNVPLSVTYATNPAVSVSDGFDVISNNEYTHLLCTSNNNKGEITIWSIERQLKMMYTFKISKFIDIILPTLNTNETDNKNIIQKVNVNAICTLPRFTTQYQQQQHQQQQQTTSSLKWKSSPTISLKTNILGSKFVIGVSIETEKKNDLYLIMFMVIDDDNNSYNNSSDEQSRSYKNKVNCIENEDETLITKNNIHQENTSKIEEVKTVVSAGTAASSTSSSGITDLTFNDAKEKNEEELEQGGIEESANDNSINTTKSLADKLKLEHVNYMKTCNVSQMLWQSLDSTSINETTNYFQDELTKLDNITSKLLQETKKFFKKPLSNKIQNNDDFKSMTTTMSTSTSTDNYSMKSLNEINVLLINFIPITLSFIENENINVNEYKIKEILAVAKNRILVHLQIEKNISKKDNNDNSSMQMDIDDCCNDDIDCKSSILLIYSYDEDGIINSRPISYRTFSKEKEPKEINVLPFVSSCHKKEEKTFFYNDNNHGGVICLVCADGSLELLAVNDLKTINIAKRENEKFVSATFCKNLERLCGCTEKGCLIFYSLHDELPDEVIMNFIDSLENVMTTTINTNTISASGNNESTTTVTADLCEIDGGRSLPPPSSTIQDSKLYNQLRSQFLSSSYSMTAESGILGSGSSRSSPTPSLLSHKTELSINDLKILYSLTLFEDELTPYTAEVPSCWNELIQAQKQRRNPQNLRPIDDSHYAKTYRLHNDA